MSKVITRFVMLSNNSPFIYIGEEEPYVGMPVVYTDFYTTFDFDFDKCYVSSIKSFKSFVLSPYGVCRKASRRMQYRDLVKIKLHENSLDKTNILFTSLNYLIKYGFTINKVSSEDSFYPFYCVLCKDNFSFKVEISKGCFYIIDVKHLDRKIYIPRKVLFDVYPDIVLSSISKISSVSKLFCVIKYFYLEKVWYEYV